MSRRKLEDAILRVAGDPFDRNEAIRFVYIHFPEDFSYIAEKCRRLIFSDSSPDLMPMYRGTYEFQVWSDGEVTSGIRGESETWTPPVQFVYDGEEFIKTI